MAVQTVSLKVVVLVIFPVAVTKDTNKRNLMKKGFILTHRPKIHYIMVEKSGAGARSNWSYHPQPRHREG